MSEYQGHRSWNAWNVALYISNDEGTYRIACDCLRQTYTLDEAVNLFCRVNVCLGDKTPDGAVYNRRSIRDALEGLEIAQKQR